MAEPPLRALVIGAGPMAVFMHLPILARLRDAGDIELACICDIDRTRAADARRTFGFRAATGDATAAIAAPDIDAVYIFASAQLHAAYGRCALENGKHLFVEKPIAPSHADAVMLADLARARGLIAVGGHNRRFYPSFDALDARRGSAGWTYAEAVFHKPMAGKAPQFGAHSWLGGNGIHALDALVFAMGGMPDRIDAATDEASTAFSALLQWPQGRQATFLCNNAAGVRREDYAFHAPGETCRVTETALVVERDGAAITSGFPAGDTSFMAEHKAFLQAVWSGAPPRHSLSALAPSLLLCELIERGHHGPVPLATVDARRPPAAQRDAILVVAAPALQPTLGALLDRFRLVSLDDIAATPRDDVVGALLGRGAEPLSDALLDTLPRLKAVGVAGLSMARYRPKALLARGIALLNASHAYAESVAEFALGLAILGRRRAFASHAIMKDGGWGVVPPPPLLARLARECHRHLRPVLSLPGLKRWSDRARRRIKSAVAPDGHAAAQVARTLRGATAGLIGWGANAEAFAVLLRAHDVTVKVYSEHAAPEAIRAAGAVPASLADVLASDIVSLHRGLTPETRHFLGTAELARLRPGSVLINVARGALIAPEALIARLARGDIYACLDTFEDEPLPAAHPLRRLPNVFLTSHIAGGSPDMHAQAAAEIVGKLAAHLDGDDAGAISADRLGNMT